MAVTEVVFFAPAYTYLDAEFTQVILERTSAVMGGMRPILMIAVTLYIVLYGWNVIAGRIGEPVLDFVLRAVKLMFVVSFATSSAFNTYVGEPLFRTFPNWLSGLFGQAGVTNPGEAFDAYTGNAMQAYAEISEKNLIEILPDLGGAVAGALVMIGAAISASIGFAILLIAMIGLAIIVMLGPIFISCIVFEPTRRFFYGWLGQAVNYLLTYTLLILVTSIVLGFTNSNALQLGPTADPIVRGVIFLSAGLVSLIFYFQIPALASGIVGGAASGIRDFTNAAGQGSRLVTGGGGGFSGGGSNNIKKG